MRSMSAIAAAVLIAGLAASGSAFAGNGAVGHSVGNFGGAGRAPSFSGNVGRSFGGNVGHSFSANAGRNFSMSPAHIRSPSVGPAFARPSHNFAPRHISRPSNHIAKPFTNGANRWQGKPYSGNHIGNHGNHHSGNHHNGHHRRHRYAYWYGAPFVFNDFGYSNDYYDGGCSVYWNRYVRTGNLKWKYRYYDCVD